MAFWQEFKAFAMKGNVMDLAVAVVIGAAFGKIVSSLVEGIIMPTLGILLNGINITNKTITVGHAIIKWGIFLQNVIDFAIIAFTIFLAIKALSILRKKEETPQETATKQEKLLIEIRDLLQKNLDAK